MAVNVYCTEKIRNKSGNITEYVMSDESGNVCNFTRKKMLELLKDKSYNVVNLKIDSAGRIVDKAVANEKQVLSKINKRSESTDSNTIFERAYTMFKHKQMIVEVIQDNRILLLDAPFNMLGTINASNIDKFNQAFEQYLHNKYGYHPSKLEVINTENNWRFIMYGEQYLECTILHRKNYFPGIANINSFKISSNVDLSRFGVYKKAENIHDKNTGKVAENAFVGVIVYDKTNKEAVDWAEKQIADLDKKAEGLSSKTKEDKKMEACRNKLRKEIYARLESGIEYTNDIQLHTDDKEFIDEISKIEKLWATLETEEGFKDMVQDVLEDIVEYEEHPKTLYYGYLGFDSNWKDADVMFSYNPEIVKQHIEDCIYDITRNDESEDAREKALKMLYTNVDGEDYKAEDWI